MLPDVVIIRIVLVTHLLHCNVNAPYFLKKYLFLPLPLKCLVSVAILHNISMFKEFKMTWSITRHLCNTWIQKMLHKYLVSIFFYCSCWEEHFEKCWLTDNTVICKGSGIDIDNYCLFIINLSASSPLEKLTEYIQLYLYNHVKLFQ